MSVTHIVEKHPEWLYVVTDIECKIIKQNESFKDFAVHIRPRSFLDIVTDKKDLDDVLAAIEKAKSKQAEPVRFFCQTKQIDNTMSWGKWHVFFIIDKLHFCGTDRSDIGSISTYEAAYSEKTIEFIKHFLNHDLRQPLSSINGVITMLVNEGSKQEMILLTQKDNYEMLLMTKGLTDELGEKLDRLIKKVGREPKS